MNWDTAKTLLKKNIRPGLRLDPEHRYKIVTEIPPYLCRNFANEEGFRVQVGERAFVNTPLSMLESLYASSLHNQSIYSRSVFQNLYPKQTFQKPCDVHAIGKLFQHAGVMEQINSREYRIIT